MSTPGSGHADFQTYGQWQGQQVFDNSITIDPGGTVVYQATLVNFASLKLEALALTGVVLAKVAYYQDAAFTIIDSSFTYMMQTNQNMAELIPNITPFVKVTLAAGSFAGATAACIVAPMSAQVGKHTYYGAAQTLSAGGTLSIPASGLRTFTPNFVIPGLAYVHFYPFDTTGKLGMNIVALDGNGNEAQDYLFYPGPATPVHDTIYFGPEGWHLNIFNVDAAAAHSCNFVVVQVGT